MSRRGDKAHEAERVQPRFDAGRSTPCDPAIDRRTLVLGTLGILGLGAAAIFGPRFIPQIYDMCCRPVCDRKPARVHAVLIDNTDLPLPGSQSQGIDQLAERFIASSRMGDHALVARLLPDAANPTDILKELCDPGRPSERGILLDTYDPDDSQRTTTYISPLRAALETAKQPSPQDKTPLVEAIKQLSASLGFYGNDKEVAKRLLIVSDALMNSGPANSYKENLSDPRAKTARAYINEFIPTLINTEVTIGLLARHNFRHRQTRDQLRWFEAYLREGGAAVISWVDLR